MTPEYLNKLEYSTIEDGDEVILKRKDFLELLDGYDAGTARIFGRIREIENRINRLLKENING